MGSHRYRTAIRWDGTTAPGYEHYDRDHRGSATPAGDELALSSDPAFRGDPSRLNPEQLLVLAASSCQLLSFLAVAARARIDVVSYTDAAEGEMPEQPPPAVMAIERIRLRPQIRLRGSVPLAKVERLVAIAHDECFIANSLRTEIIVEPTITFDAE